MFEIQNILILVLCLPINFLFLRFRGDRDHRPGVHRSDDGYHDDASFTGCHIEALLLETVRTTRDFISERSCRTIILDGEIEVLGVIW